MAFKLFRLDNSGEKIPTSFDDLDNKAFWCEHGNKQEEAFVDVMSKMPKLQYSAIIHPEKVFNSYYPDLLVTDKASEESYIGEVKIKNSPLFMANTYGVNPQFALTMDLKDSFNYLNWLRNGTDIRIFIWVVWEAHVMETDYKNYTVKPMKGIWTTKFSTLRDFEVKHPPGIHWYKEKFRHPTIYKKDEEIEWCKRLYEFDSRLFDVNTCQTKNITSNGYMESDGTLYPAGQSSASYVFDLSNQNLFERLVYWTEK